MNEAMNVANEASGNGKKGMSAASGAGGAAAGSKRPWGGGGGGGGGQICIPPPTIPTPTHKFAAYCNHRKRFQNSKNRWAITPIDNLNVLSISLFKTVRKSAICVQLPTDGVEARF